MSLGCANLTGTPCAPMRGPAPRRRTPREATCSQAACAARPAAQIARQEVYTQACPRRLRTPRRGRRRQDPPAGRPTSMPSTSRQMWWMPPALLRSRKAATGEESPSGSSSSSRVLGRSTKTTVTPCWGSACGSLTCGARSRAQSAVAAARRHRPCCAGAPGAGAGQGRACLGAEDGLVAGSGLPQVWHRDRHVVEAARAEGRGTPLRHGGTGRTDQTHHSEHPGGTSLSSQPGLASNWAARGVAWASHRPACKARAAGRLAAMIRS